MFWKEDIEDLVLSKRRKLTIILNNLDEMENEKIKEILSMHVQNVVKGISLDENKFTKEVDVDVTNIMGAYGMLRNMFVEYYYPDAETKSYYDVYPSEDEE